MTGSFLVAGLLPKFGFKLSSRGSPAEQIHSPLLVKANGKGGGQRSWQDQRPYSVKRLTALINATHNRKFYVTGRLSVKYIIFPGLLFKKALFELIILFYSQELLLKGVSCP